MMGLLSSRPSPATPFDACCRLKSRSLVGAVGAQAGLREEWEEGEARGQKGRGDYGLVDRYTRRIPMLAEGDVQVQDRCRCSQSRSRRPASKQRKAKRLYLTKWRINSVTIADREPVQLRVVPTVPFRVRSRCVSVEFRVAGRAQSMGCECMCLATCSICGCKCMSRTRVLSSSSSTQRALWFGSSSVLALLGTCVVP